jgi:hypothetical protein
VPARPQNHMAHEAKAVLADLPERVADVE